jgi:cation:H+ antiporter
MWLSIALVIAGTVLVLFFAGLLVQGTIGVARGFGLSAFVVSVVFLGFDPENLAVGAVGSFEGATGIALGTIVGSAMVAIAPAFGITALIVPLHFEQAPRQILVVPILATSLLGLLAWDGQLSRTDGISLLAGYTAATVYLYWLSRHGVDIRGAGLGKKTEKAEGIGRAKAIGLLVLSLLMIVVGGEFLVIGATDLIKRFGLSQTLIGMTVVALAISVEELGRELPAALKGHPEISFGNVVGSVLTFFLFNAGIIALVCPVDVGEATLKFYLPAACGTIALISAFLLFRRIPRWAGAVLIAAYIGFAAGGYLLYGASPTGGTK